MKLKEGFIILEMSGESVMIATEDASKEFRGIVRNNKTAAYIASLLLHETTREEIIDNILNRYEVDRDTVEKDVDKIIGEFEKAGFFE